MRIDHVALLVPSLEEAARRLEPFRGVMGEIEEFPEDGTREMYIGPRHGSALLLLIEPADASGHYARSLAKRRSGLHHLGIRVPSIPSFMEAIRGSGWFLLPRSLHSVKTQRTAWLARPGVPALIEIQQAKPRRGVPFVERVELPVGDERRLIESLSHGDEPLEGLFASADGSVWLTIGGERRSATELIQGVAHSL